MDQSASLTTEPRLSEVEVVDTERLRPGATAARLAELEDTIDRGLRTFLQVGRALVEIRERRLYRSAGHATFADYTKQRWGMSRGHAYRTIDAARVVGILQEASVEPLPVNEAQARELARLMSEPDALRKAWLDVVSPGAGGISARAVRSAVDDRLGAPDKPARRPRAPAHRTSHTCPSCGHEWTSESVPTG
jgi:hypothetical protein